MKLVNATEAHGKSGVWGTLRLVEGEELKRLHWVNRLRKKSLPSAAKAGLVSKYFRTG